MLAREKGCPVGTGTALYLPSRALGSSPLLMPCLGFSRRDGGNPVRGGSVVLSDPPATRRPASGTAPHAREWLRGGKASRHAAVRKGRPRRPAQGLPALHKEVVDCQVWCELFFPVAQPCPWSVERCHLFCTEPRGRGEERACAFDSCTRIISTS